MCGIAGWIRWDGETVDPALIEAMAWIQAHRGPDDEGFLFFNPRSREARFTQSPLSANGFPAAFAHRRLSIIDTSTAGRQPFESADSSLWLTYNGEIYNYVELRDELRHAGHTFKSRTDTEVILEAYRAWGPDSFERLNGMFAFALWDKKAGRVFLVRDRFGVKPLYYRLREGRSLAFASEIKALLVDPDVPTELDVRSLTEHLSFQYSFGRRTLFEGIEILRPGTVLEVDVETGRTREPVSFYDLPVRDAKEAAPAWLRETFEASVRRQLRSDVPVGAFLSGGMDSGSICAVAQAVFGELNTFTCGFELDGVEGREVHYDERKEARDLAEKKGTIHHELVLKPGDMEAVFNEVTWHVDEPRVGISYQIYHICRLVREHVTVVLSGIGGDELFGGYPWRYLPVMGLHDRAAFDDAYFDLWCRILNEERKKRLLTPGLWDTLDGYTARDGFQTEMDAQPDVKPLTRALAYDVNHFLHGLFLIEDKLSMAHSLETRVPFMDNELFEIAVSLPPKQKIRDTDDGAMTKVLLKQALADLLPDEMLSRRKQGFTPPDRTWYRGPALPFIRDMLFSERTLQRGWFRKSAMEEILDEHLSGAYNHRFLIWSLMSLEQMARHFMDGDGLADARKRLLTGARAGRKDG